MQFQTLTDLIHIVRDLLLATVPVIAALALLYFFWGIAQFISSVGNAEEAKKGRGKIVWGLVVLIIMFTIAGILMLLRITFFHVPGSEGQSPYGGYGPGVTSPVEPQSGGWFSLFGTCLFGNCPVR